MKQVNKEKLVSALSRLIEFDSSREELVKHLSTIEWERHEDVIELDREKLNKVLAKYLNDKLEASDLEWWAESLEARSEIKYENDVKEVIFFLANPTINKKISKDLVRGLVK